MKTLVVRSFSFINLLPEVFVYLFFSLTCHQCLSLFFKILKLYVTVSTVTSEDVCCSIRNVKFTLNFYKNVYNRCLFSFPFEIEMAEEQEYLRLCILLTRNHTTFLVQF